MTNCMRCRTKTRSTSNLYCSNQCQLDYQYEQYLLRWKQGIESGSKGITSRSLSGHVRRYILIKYNSSCCICGWCKLNPITKQPPLEVDHIDGNSDNNLESNLRLLCPNCHSLTPNYKKLNNGNGREWRRIKYIKNS